MSEGGARGLLAVWTDIPAALEADFNAWYDREHLAERASIPGFLNARRYIAVSAQPRYFALYETRSVAVLTSPEYRRFLGPGMSAWSRRITSEFRNNHRLCCTQLARAGDGIGGVVAVARLDGADALVRRLEAGALAAALEAAGTIAVQAWRADLGATFPDGAPAGAAAETVLVVHGGVPAAAAAGLDRVLAAAQAGVLRHRGLYALMNSLPS